MRRLDGIATVGLVAALATAGCGSSHEGAAARTTAAPAAPRQARHCAVGFQPLVSARTAWAAIVKRRLEVRRTPGGPAFATLGTINVNGVPMVLGVLGVRRSGCRPAWYRVQLPLKPNGVTGWVRAADVAVAPVSTRVVVDLSARRVTLYRRGKEVLQTAAAIGSPATPTPTGRFYVNQRLVPDDPSGPFGPGAIGISAFSTVLTHWTQGGPIAIHGTNEPWSIGKNVSNGCIRVPNAMLRRLFAAAVAGTPVLIRR